MAVGLITWRHIVYNLDDNYLPDSSCIHLASVIRNNQFLKRLDLSGNHLSGPHLNDLMEALSSPVCGIEELLLGRNNLPDTFCTQLASVIRNNQYLKKIDLSINCLSGPHFSDLVEALSSSDSQIKELHMGGNAFSVMEVMALRKLEWDKPSLKIVY